MDMEGLKWDETCELAGFNAKSLNCRQTEQSKTLHLTSFGPFGSLSSVIESALGVKRLTRGDAKTTYTCK
jgi:hypothetical protein